MIERGCNQGEPGICVSLSAAARGGWPCGERQLRHFFLPVRTIRSRPRLLRRCTAFRAAAMGLFLTALWQKIHRGICMAPLPSVGPIVLEPCSRLTLAATKAHATTSPAVQMTELLRLPLCSSIRPAPLSTELHTAAAPPGAALSLSWFHATQAIRCSILSPLPATANILMPE